MSFFSEIKERWNAQTPTFFTKLKKLATTLGTSALAVLGASSIPNIVIPVIIIKIASHILIACAVLGVTSQLTKTDTPTT